MGKSRSISFERFNRALKISEYCSRNKLPSNIGYELMREMEQKQLAEKINRRQFIKNAGKAAAMTGFLSNGYAQKAIAGNFKRDLKIAVVGAGFGGLVCAYELQRFGINPVVFEAGTRVGGRCFSTNEEFPNQVVERGGEFLNTSHKILLGYANQFGLKLEDYNKEPGEEVFWINGQKYMEHEVVDEYRAFKPIIQEDISKLSSEISPSNYTEADFLLDHLSLEDYLDSRGAGPILKPMLKAAYIGEYGLELDQQSCLNMLLYIHADRRSSWRPFGVFGDERYHVIGGNQQIAEGLMQGLSQEIQFDKKLTAAIRKANGQVELVFDDGETSKWDAVVLAIPFSTLREVDLSRLNLPEDKTNAINRSTHGTNSKLMVGFNGPIWKNAGFNGSTLVDGLDSIQVTWESNPTGARDSHAVLTNYTGGQLGAGLNSNDLNHEVSKFLLDLESIYAGSEKNALQTPDGNYVADLTNWVEEPLSKGSYTCNQPGYFTSIHLIEGRPEENVYFTGEHCDTFYEWQGFMEGAARSAIQTATQIARDYVGNLGKDGK